VSAASIPAGGSANEAVPRPLGTELLEAGLVERSELDEALTYARRWRVPLGRALVALGFLRPLDLYRILARQLGLPFLDLRRFPVDPDLLDPNELDTYVAWQAVPWRRVRGLSLIHI